MDSIRIKIKRIRAFSGFLFPRFLSVDGKPVNGIKNGGTWEISAKRSGVIFIADEGSVLNNAVIFPNDCSEISLDMRVTGNLMKGYRGVFYPEGSSTPCRSVSFERLLTAIDGDGPLTELQRRFAVLVRFIEAFDLEEVLRSSYAPELIVALKSLGANLCASTLERIINTEFRDFVLPIEGGEADESLRERFANAENMQLDADANGRLTEELHRACANCISAHFNELFSEGDLYYYDKRNANAVKNTGSAHRSGTKWTRARIGKLLKAVLIVILLEGAIVCLWRYGAYYPSRAALENNSVIVTVQDPHVELDSGTANGNYRIYIQDDNEKYTLFWSNTPRLDMSAREFAEAIGEEPELELTVKDDGSVCAVSGQDRTYLSVEAFNKYQRTQCTIGTVLCAVFGLIGIFGLLIAALLIIPFIP